MKDEQRTERIMEWVESRMSAADATAFEEEMADDAELAQECALMAELASRLHDLDVDMEPSADFHRRLMAAICLDNEQTERKPVIDIMVEKDTTEKKKSGAGVGAGRKLFHLFRNRPLIPVAAAVCLVAFVALALSNLPGRYGRVNYGERGYDSYSYNREQLGIARSGLSSWASGGGGGSGGTTSSGVADYAMPQSAPPPPMAIPVEDASMMRFEVMEAESYDSMEDDGMRAAYGAGVDDAGAYGNESPQPPVEQKIIRSGHLNIEVDRYDLAVADIRFMVSTLGGHVTSESSYIIDGRERRSGHMQLKVPFDRFDYLIEQVEDMGKVFDVSIWAEDVTSRFIDLQARMSVYETKQQRLMALLRQSGELADLLAVERELASTIAELESLKGQMRWLLDRTDFSTLGVSLTEKPVEAVEIRTSGFEGFAQNVKESFFLGVNSVIRSFGNSIIWMAWYLTRFVLIALVLTLLWFLFVRRWVRRFKATKERAKENRTFVESVNTADIAED